MSSARKNHLIDQFRSNQLTPSEHEELLGYLSDDEEFSNLFFSEQWTKLGSEDDFFCREKGEELLRNVVKAQTYGLKSRPSISRFNRFFVAASFLLISAICLIVFKQTKNENYLVPANAQLNKRNDIVLPGRNVAILTLSDQKQINLEDSGQGVLAKEIGVTIEKTADGQITYFTPNEDKLSHTKTSYNTITIPVGGQYNIVLPDGTVVWLNSASSLKYPTVFNTNTRKVELMGEAYFEVAKDKTKPFYVVTKKTKVEVLGTHFNVSAYEDDAVTSTTLLEGSVKISVNNQSLIIKPGDQAVVGGANSLIKVAQVDTEETVAWKEGHFIFADENIHSIMKKLSRWYGVEVQFQSDNIEETFGGTISKYKNLSEVLNLLSETQTIRFKVVPAIVGNGRRVLVMK